MNYKAQPIQKPTAREKRTLRLMIVAGIFSMYLFLSALFGVADEGSGYLYVLLMITISYSCLKFLHEWYHYFSITVPETGTVKGSYTVDIFTTWCPGEPIDMLEQTLRAIQKIDYPHTAWCCDEGDNPVIKALCEKLQVQHVTRTKKINAKAGNINNALQFATGDICVILDPDHVPAPDLLDPVLHHFDNPKVGFVQMVQAYYNHHDSLIAKGAAQQTYQFYGPMMMSMHAYGTVQAIGANCIFRRAALDSIGGHSPGLAEDMNTAMHLHAHGWKSVYVPAVLTRGLVPASLSAYYKQQLKWSRGTFELLVTTYPKFFNQFTWRQKLHYFTLPFHYLCGLIALLNFIIPVLSLFSGNMPLHLDIVSFALVAVPFVAMTMLIRHYVQKWVAEETERGFHIVGGLLQIGTWWVHLAGFVYTLLRKKVPYIPTPKDDADPTPFKLHIPNLLVVIVSVSAMIYGLSYDYNPFSIFMASLAALNILIMLFVFYASTTNRKKFVAYPIQRKVKAGLWIMRHRLYAGMRRYALPLSIVVMLLSFYAYRQHMALPEYVPEPMPGHKVFYAGIFQPSANDGLTSVQQVRTTGKSGSRFSIVSFYIPWGAALPVDSFKQVYAMGAVPMVTWEPWPSGFGDTSNQQVCNKILAGNYDQAILSFAKQLTGVRKPVFLRFAHEPGNERYPWSHNYGNTPEQYVAAWKHVHDLFNQNGDNEVIWVWSPWTAGSAAAYFPGNAYVDWLAVDVLDYERYNSQKSSSSFGSIYRPFHRLPLFQSGLPVMIAESGTLSPDSKAWWKKAKTVIDTAFPEIRSIIVFNDKYDHYYPDGYHAEPLDWSHNSAPMLDLFRKTNPILAVVSPIPHEYLHTPPSRQLPDTLKAVVYDKALYWFRNRHTLHRNEMESDLAGIKKMGINTLVRTLPGIYDNSLLKSLKQYDLQMIARLWLSTRPEYINDTVKMKKEQDLLLQIVKKYSNEPSIIAWNLGNDVLRSTRNRYYKPDYFYYKNNYIQWLSSFCKALRALDPKRPITMDIYWDKEGPDRLSYYKSWLPEVDSYTLIADSSNAALLQQPLPANCVWGNVPTGLWHLLPSKHKLVLSAWQDIENRHFVALQGILDLDGRRKPGYDTVAYYWANNKERKRPLPDIKILKPAKITYENTNLVYQVLVRKEGGGWQFFDSTLFQGLHFEWYLVRTDQYGTTLYMKKAKEGPTLDLQTPKYPQLYRLYLKAISGNRVKEASSTLNIPLN